MKKDMTIVIAFLVILIIPTIIYWFIEDKMDLLNYEKRDLYDLPELKFEGITNFPKQYENYYNDHLPFKNEIRKIRSKLLYGLLNTSYSPRVILGEDGWMFYNSVYVNDGDSISDYRKNTRFTNEEKEKTKTTISMVNEKLNKKGIKLILFIIPNKETVYSDKLDSIISRSDNELSKTEDLIDYLKNETNVNIVYPKENLLSNRTQSETYYKYDTHWNNYGAYVGVIDLINNIDKDFSPNKIEINKEKKIGGDLATMNISTFVESYEPIVTNDFDSSYDCKDVSNYKLCNSTNPKYNKTIMFIGDSFRVAAVQYVAKLFKKSIFIHRSDYKEDLIEKYNVKTVIYETVERYSHKIMNVDMLLNK